jgi:membrane protein CcdC involved in cytochrome C biogenesis
MVVPAALTPVLKLAGVVAPVAGGAAVMVWRFQETRTPVTAKKILIPPLGMSTGFFMFVSPAMRFPLSWGIGAFLFGALVLSWPLARTSTLEREDDVILMRRSPFFLVILLGLLALRLGLHDQIGHLLPPKQTAAFFFVLAFGMIVRWRASMYRAFLRLQAE